MVFRRDDLFLLIANLIFKKIKIQTEKVRINIYIDKIIIIDSAQLKRLLLENKELIDKYFR